MTEPAVTVVVPSYNHSAFVAETIASIARQTFDDFELLVIDDGSGDGSPAVIEKALAANPFRHAPRLLTQQNRGVAATLNRGLAEARGRYFAYLGSDDLWEPRKLELQVAELDAHPFAVAAYADCWIIDAAGQRVDRKGAHFDYRGGDIYLDLLRLRFQPPSPTNLFRTEAVREAGGFDERLAVEDYSLWVRLCRRGPAAYVDQPLASHRVHGANTTTARPEAIASSNRATIEGELAADPRLAPLARELRLGAQAHAAASYYSAFELGKARRLALGVLLRQPSNADALRVFFRSLLGRSMVGRMREKAAETRSLKILK